MAIYNTDIDPNVTMWNKQNEKPTMKKFTVTTSAPCTQYWTYEIEAETEEQAIEIALSGEHDPDDYYVEDDGWNDIEVFESYEIVENGFRKQQDNDSTGTN